MATPALPTVTLRQRLFRNSGSGFSAFATSAQSFCSSICQHRLAAPGSLQVAKLVPDLPEASGPAIFGNWPGAENDRYLSTSLTKNRSSWNTRLPPPRRAAARTQAHRNKDGNQTHQNNKLQQLDASQICHEASRLAQSGCTCIVAGCRASARFARKPLEEKRKRRGEEKEKR